MHLLPGDTWNSGDAGSSWASRIPISYWKLSDNMQKDGSGYAPARTVVLKQGGTERSRGT